MRRDYLEHLTRFFLPTPELTREILLTHAELVAADLSEPDEEDTFEDKGEASPPQADVDTGPRIEQGRYVISERLYRYLAYLSRTPRAHHRLPFDLYELVPSSMEALLGVEGSEGRQQPLLMKLTREFRDAMFERHRGMYRAPWGAVTIDPKGRSLVIISSDLNEGEPDRPYARAVERVRTMRRR